MFKRITSFLLVLSMVLSMLPAQVYAVQTEETLEITEATTIPTEAAAETSGAATAPAEETTLPTEGTSVPTEETAPASEETAAPTEETVVTEVTEEAAATVVASGNCGPGITSPADNLEWVLYSNGHLDITGSGEMGFGGPWKNKGVPITSVSLPGELTTIGSYAFSGTEITYIDIPDTVETIGIDAFANSALQSVYLPDSVTMIDNGAFEGCSDLEEVLNWPANLMTINSWAFRGCKSLKTACFPGLATNGAAQATDEEEPEFYVGSQAFYDCVSLESVTIRTGITTIESATFYGCKSLRIIHIPEGVTSIGSSAFHGCSALERVSLPETLESIGSNAFQNCTALPGVEIPCLVKSIDGYAFSGCKSLSEVLFLDTIMINGVPIAVAPALETLGNGVFSVCSALDAIDFPSGLTTIGENAFDRCTALREIDLSGSVTHIGRRAFAGCEALTEVTIPAGIQQIDEYAFDSCFGLQEVTIESSQTQLGDYLFNYCKNLTKVNLPEDMTHIPNGFLYLCGALENFEIPEGFVSIGDYAFSYCKKLTNVKLPDTLTSIGSHAFNNCDAFTSVTIPGSVETYGEYIFQDCSALVNVNIPKDLKVIPVGLLRNCEKIEYITLPEELEGIENSAFAGCEGLKEINLPTTLKHIGNNAFSGCFQLTEVSVPDSVTDLGDYAFSYCIRLKTAKLPKGMEIIPTGLFSLCSALETVRYPDVVKEYSSNVFNTCYSLKEAYLPDTLTAIGDYAFQDCWTITEVKLPATIETYGSNIFDGCYKLETVELPNNLKTLPPGIFKDCSGLENLELSPNMETLGETSLSGTGLKRITVPKTVTNVAGYVFHSCRNLEEITFLGNVKSIGNYAFYACEALKKITIPESVETIGSGVFRKCKSLLEIMLPEKIERIESYTFSECTDLENIVIPAGTKHIGAYAFDKCDALKDVYFCGTESDWKLVFIDSYNDPLKSAKIHYNGTKDSGELPGGMNWDITVRHVLNIHGDGVLQGFSSETDTPWFQYRDKIAKIYIRGNATSIGSYAFAGLENVTTVYIPASVTRIEDKAFSGCTALEKILYLGSLEEWEKVKIGEGNEPLQQAEVVSLKITDFTDNRNITINYRGSAIAYFKTMPNTYIEYVRNATLESHTYSDANGIFKVDLGTFEYPDQQSILIRITKLGDERLDPAIPIYASVEVTPLEFTQKWEVSFDVEGTVGVYKGVKAAIGPLELSAKVGEANLKGTVGRSINISREFGKNGETLELTSDVRGGIGADASVGIELELLPVTFTPIKVSGEVDAVISDTYGLKAENYSKDNRRQQRGIGAFFLGELITAQYQNSPMIRELYSHLIASHVFRESGCEFVSGNALEFATEVNADLFTLSIGEEDLFGDGSDVDAGAEWSLMTGTSQFGFETGIKGESTGEMQLTTGLMFDNEINIFKKTLDLGYVEDVDWSALDLAFGTTEVELTCKSKDGEESLTAKMLRNDKTGNKVYVKDETTASIYDSYTLREDMLRGLDYGTIRENKGKRHSGFGDLITVAAAITRGEVPIEYQSILKSENMQDFNLPLSFGAGLALGLGFEAAYMEETEVVTATGVQTPSGKKMITETTNLSAAVEQRKHSFWEIFENAISSLAQDVADLFEVAVETINEGLELLCHIILPNPDADENLEVSVTAARETGAQAVSYKVATRRTQTAMNDHSGIRAEDVETKDSRTVGRSALISVRNRATGETVTDFSDTPLTFIIRYAEEDLEAAGLGKDSETVPDGGIAMYRYSDDGDYLEYIGGHNDPEAMTVTAQITKPGQYVLAADSCAPEITNLELSDFHSSPTITAYVDDLTGLDARCLVFKLDGQTKVDASNVSDHYNAATGKFTYTVSQDTPLAEGEHTLSFTLADTTGNAQTYDYSFQVDLTAPAVSDVSVTGTTNKNSAVAIRAKVNDAHLNKVYAVFSRLEADGSWSKEAAVAMGDLGDGQWGLDYEGDGSVVRVYVKAVDIAANVTESDTFEVVPLVEDLTLGQEYVALREGQSIQLKAQTQPAALMRSLEWSVDDEAVATVDGSGTVTAKRAGMTYATVTVTDGETTLTARCRIDVAEPLNLEGVQLSCDNTTVELYSRAYPELDILLKLPQNYVAASEDAPAGKKLSAAIDEAYFTEEAVRNMFSVKVLDDRRVQIVPTGEALDDENLAKSYCGTITVVVEGRTYETGELTIKVKKTTPKLKATVASFNSFYSGQTQPIAVTGATVTAIALDPGKTQPDWLTLTKGALRLTENAPRKNVSGKVYLLVETEEWAVPMPVKVSVKNAYKEPALKLSSKSITLNTAVRDSAVITVSAECDLSELNYRLTDNSGKVDKSGELTVSHENGTFTIGTTEAAKGAYKLHISLPGGKEVALSIKTVSAAVSVTFKVKGNPDTNIPGKSAEVVPAFKNYNGGFTIAELTAEDVKKQDATAWFEATQEDHVIRVICRPDTPVGAYTLKLKLQLDDGSSVEKTAKVNVKQTALKLKLSSGKLSLNKAVGDVASVTVTSATRGYTLAEPVWQLMDKSGRQSADGKLDIRWTDGKLMVAANNATEYGGAYKLLVKANGEAPAQTLTVTVPAENKSTVTATLKAKGGIDVIRSGSALTIAPSYKNCSAETEKEETLIFYKTVGKQTVDASDLFTYTKENGVFAVTKAPGAVLDHSAKYTVKLVSRIGDVVIESKPASLSVKMGTAKLAVKAEDTTLFAMDKNDRALVWFEAADESLNDAAKVAFKNAKQAELFELIEYGDGTWAIGFRDGKVDKSLVGKTVTVNLNVFIEGNQTTKANATVNVKLTVVK